MAVALTTLFAIAAPARAESRQSSWDGVCYAGFAAHVERLAGADAVDCGLHRHGDVAGRKSAMRCMRRASASGRTYKVGVLSAQDPIDSCHVAIEKASALPLRLLYFRDSPMWNSGKGRVLVQRCHDILAPGKPGDLRLFDVDDCADARELLPELGQLSSWRETPDAWVDVRAVPP